MTELKIFKAEDAERFKPATSDTAAIGGQILIWDNCDTTTDSTLPLTGGQYTTAIKELTDAILDLFGDEETDREFYQDKDLYMSGKEVNAAIQLAKKYQQLIEGKS